MLTGAVFERIREMRVNPMKPAMSAREAANLLEKPRNLKLITIDEISKILSSSGSS